MSAINILCEDTFGTSSWQLINTSVWTITVSNSIELIILFFWIISDVTLKKTSYENLLPCFNNAVIVLITTSSIEWHYNTHVYCFNYMSKQLHLTDNSCKFAIDKVDLSSILKQHCTAFPGIDKIRIIMDINRITIVCYTY
jgi:hypothetical protein